MPACLGSASTTNLIPAERSGMVDSERENAASHVTLHLYRTFDFEVCYPNPFSVESLLVHKAGKAKLGILAGTRAS